MKLQLLVRQYPRMIGLARYTHSLQASLTALGVEYSVVEPAYPLPVRAAHRLLRPLGYDVRTFFTNYPAAAPLQADAVKHFTTQMMASLLAFRQRLHRVVITVHDIVPYLVRDDPQQSTFAHPLDRFFDSLAMHSLRKAELLICDSACTARMLVEHLSCSPDKIRIIHIGVDHDLFHPVSFNGDFLPRFGLPKDARFILYVGSENPRKNLPRLLQALSKLKPHLPDVKLLKVGTPEYLPDNQRLRKLVQDLDLEETVIFTDHLSQADLTRLYSSASLFVFPSLYEGFGLPVLEAMACGTPVVTSNASSLPEVAGDAALLVDPYDVDAISSAMHSILEDPDLAQDLRERGLARAAQFTWERTARETLAVYQQVLDASSP